MGAYPIFGSVGGPNGVVGLRVDGYSPSTQIRRRIRPIGPNAPWTARSSASCRGAAFHTATSVLVLYSRGSGQKLLSYKRRCPSLGTAGAALDRLERPAQSVVSVVANLQQIRKLPARRHGTIPDSTSVTDTL